MNLYGYNLQYNIINFDSHVFWIENSVNLRQHFMSILIWIQIYNNIPLEIHSDKKNKMFVSHNWKQKFDQKYVYICIQLGGPTWTVQLGRRDATTASFSDATSNIPKPTSDLSTLISDFSSKGLTTTDLTALSGISFH
jgi:Peroxidase